jgi:hypothetical protein
MYTPYEQGVIAERERCCRVLCALCAAAEASGRLADGSYVGKVRQHRGRFYHQINALQGSGSREEACAAARLLVPTSPTF